MNRRILALNLVELGFTAFETLTSEAPLALNTPKAVAGRPLSRAMERTSAMPSCTSAISRSRTDRPPPAMIWVSARSSALLAPPSTRIACSPPPDLGAAARGVEIQRPQLIVDLDRGQPERLQARGIELDADLAAHAAAARDLRNPRNRQQALGDGVVDEPAELLRRVRRWW